jgi:predicted DNA-binding transcriptional regulator YafY
MRASRLVSIILLLQARGRLTAAQLARELEASVRTVYRDVESLHMAGIPLYGDAGHRGGYQLLDGYQARLTGLSAEEAKALSLSGLPGPAAERLSPAAAARLTGPDGDAIAATGVQEPDGWTRAVLPIESVDLAIRGFLTPDIEVLDPPGLRAQVAARARAIAALY